MPQTSTDAALGLGCSLGSRARRLELTARRIQADPRVRIVAASRLYRTPPMKGGTARGWFLNAVLRIQTELTSAELLDMARRLEHEAGRRRARHWGDRTLDIDVLLFGDQVASDAELILPHPGVPSRAFVRTPLLEVWPDAQDPTTGALYSAYAPPLPPRAVPVACFPGGWISKI